MTPALRSTGYLPDLPDPRDHSYERLAGALPRALTYDSLRRFAPPALDQGQTQSCVAHAIAAAVYVRLGVQGDRQALPSRLALYYLARRQHGAQLLDAGTYPRMAWRAVGTVGYAPESVLPWSESAVLAAPASSWLLARGSIDQLGAEYQRIDGAGPVVEDQVRDALAAGFPVCVGLAIDAAFESYGGLGPWEIRGPAVGRHYVCAVGASTDGLVILNSSGPDWGADGLGLVAWRQIQDPYLCTDRWVLVRAPRFAEAA